MIALGRRTAAALSDIADPWLLLIIRIWLAQAFVVLQVSMFMHGHGLTAAFGGQWWLDALGRVATSGAGGLVQALCPLLLAAGLLTRVSAAAMILQVALFRMGLDHDLQTLWAAALVGIVALGPGPLSLDRLLGAGARVSALPGRRLAGVLQRFAVRAVAPAYLVALRVLVALAVAGPHWQPMRATMLAAMAGHLPPAPGVVAALPATAALTVAAALAAGFAVRPLAVLLLVLAPGTAGLTIADARLYWLILLALMLTRGGGPLALDTLVARWLDRIVPATDRTGLPHVVIVGGGFGGLAVARGLRRASCRITLVDARNHHLFQPLLYQVATAGLSPADIATPIRALFRRQGNVRVLLGAVRGIDPARREVALGSTRIGYDMLVLATGARHSYLGHDHWSAIAPGLKTIDDATAIRRRLLLAFEAAETAADATERQAWQTFVIVGGGPTGVELAGAIAELARFGLEGDFRAIMPAETRVVLVQSGPLLIPGFPLALSHHAAAYLTDLGVELRLGGRAEAIDADGVTVGGERIAARTVLWAAGVMASPAARWLDAEADRSGRIVVGPDLGVPGHPAIFAIGDTAASNGWRGRPVPGLAPAAKQGGAYVARVIAARLAGRPAPAPFAYRHMGSLATIGRRAAVADFGWLHLRGALAWWVWGGAHILFLVGGRNRAGVALAWLWDYFTLRRGTRLITGADAAE